MGIQPAEASGDFKRGSPAGELGPGQLLLPPLTRPRTLAWLAANRIECIESFPDALSPALTPSIAQQDLLKPILEQSSHLSVSPDRLRCTHPRLGALEFPAVLVAIEEPRGHGSRIRWGSHPDYPELTAPRTDRTLLDLHARARSAGLNVLAGTTTRGDSPFPDLSFGRLCMAILSELEAAPGTVLGLRGSSIGRAENLTFWYLLRDQHGFSNLASWAPEPARMTLIREVVEKLYPIYPFCPGALPAGACALGERCGFMTGIWRGEVAWIRAREAVAPDGRPLMLLVAGGDASDRQHGLHVAWAHHELDHRRPPEQECV